MSDPILHLLSELHSFLILHPQMIENHFLLIISSYERLEKGKEGK